MTTDFEKHGHNYAVSYDRAIVNAIDECCNGRHVAHVTNSSNGRTVAIRPDSINLSFLNLTFSDPKRDHRIDAHHVNTNASDEKNAVTHKAAIKMIHTFLTARAVAKTTAGYFHGVVNQKMRPIDIIKVNPTRIRIEYELPTAGMVQAWRPYMDIGNYRYIGAGA